MLHQSEALLRGAASLTCNKEMQIQTEVHTVQERHSHNITVIIMERNCLKSMVTLMFPNSLSLRHYHYDYYNLIHHKGSTLLHDTMHRKAIQIHKQ